MTCESLVYLVLEMKGLRYWQMLSDNLIPQVLVRYITKPGALSALHIISRLVTRPRHYCDFSESDSCEIRPFRHCTDCGLSIVVLITYTFI